MFNEGLERVEVPLLRIVLTLPGPMRRFIEQENHTGSGVIEIVS